MLFMENVLPTSPLWSMCFVLMKHTLPSDPPLLRLQAGCKFVDAVEPECPYIMNDEYLMHIIDKWNIDFVVHGDDPCLVDGKGA